MKINTRGGIDWAGGNGHIFRERSRNGDSLFVAPSTKGGWGDAAPSFGELDSRKPNLPPMQHTKHGLNVLSGHQVSVTVSLFSVLNLFIYLLDLKSGCCVLNY